MFQTMTVFVVFGAAVVAQDPESAMPAWAVFANYGVLGLISLALGYTFLGERKQERLDRLAMQLEHQRALKAVAISQVGLQKQLLIQAFSARLDLNPDSDDCRECRRMFELILKSVEEQGRELELLKC